LKSTATAIKMREPFILIKIHNIDQLRADYQSNFVPESLRPDSGRIAVLNRRNRMSLSKIDRRSWLRSMLGPAALFGLNGAVLPRRGNAAAIGQKEQIKVTKIETFVLKNSWVFVKISTNSGVTGWGEMLKDDAKACAAGALE